jgi:hypothetical protein
MHPTLVCIHLAKNLGILSSTYACGLKIEDGILHMSFLNGTKYRHFSYDVHCHLPILPVVQIVCPPAFFPMVRGLSTTPARAESTINHTL